MAHFTKPLKTAAADTFFKKSDGALTAMILTGGGPHHVVLWGGDRTGKELTLVAKDASGGTFATVTRVGLEGGHPVDPDGDHLWFIKYEISAPAAGTGTLTAVDAAGMPFARIDLVVNKGGARSAVILVPSQGKDVGSFLSVAAQLNKDVYGSKATIVKSKVLPGNDFVITTLDGKAFDITSKSDLSSFVIVSHCSFDGPNLAFKSEDKSISEHQVLRVDKPAASEKASKFWQDTGRALNGAGKVILLGCHSAVFAPRVTPLLGRRVFGVFGDCPAGDVNFSVPQAAAVETGKAKKPMVVAGPPAA